MKYDPAKERYRAIAMRVLLVILLGIFAVFALLNFDVFWGILWNIISVLSPILIGAMLTYLFSPIVGLFERRVYQGLDKKKKYRLKRVLSVISMFILVILFLLILVLKVIPAVIRGYADLAIMSDMYLELLKEWMAELEFGGAGMLAGYFDTLIGYAAELLDRVYSAVFEMTPDVASLAGTLVGLLGDVVLGIILSIYFLFSKERIFAQFKKMIRALLSRRRFGAFERSVKVTNEKFGGFLKGQILDALILGVLSYVCLAIIGVPYYPLVSVLVCMASLVPVFGMLIGAVIGTAIILLADPYDVRWFVLFMLGLYLVNKFLIKPRVVRTTVDASSVFMLSAIVVMTGLMGFWGLILGVPIFAVGYAFLHSFINRRLTGKGLPTDAYEYYSTNTGKDLYLEREVERRDRKRRRGGKGDDPVDIFGVHDDESEDEDSLFSHREKEERPASENEFPQ